MHSHKVVAAALARPAEQGTALYTHQNMAELWNTMMRLSHARANLIRQGTKTPHPKHWVTLAKLRE